MKTDAQGKSDIGQRRKVNEDYFCVDNERGIFIVCDGMGGHAAGEVASQKAVEFTMEFLVRHWDQVIDARNHPIGTFKLNQIIERTIHETCHLIYELAQEDPNLRSMGTTLTLLLVLDGKAFVGHVGDSRLYIKRGDQVFLLTTDHTVYNEMIAEFTMVNQNDIKKLRHCLTRSVGNRDTVAVETLSFDAQKDDLLLLCTDGLSNYFGDGTNLAKLLEGDHVNEIADSLISFANEQGGKDNITALVIKILDVDDFSVNPHRISIGSGEIDDSDDVLDEEPVTDPHDTLPFVKRKP
ncbi:MAG: protein phosphatase 2C domain-containing protein [Planctomycetota bacterium]